MDASTSIQDKYDQTLQQVMESAKSAGRKPEEIRLVVVTKTQPLEKIQLLIDAGAVNFGENYIEEAVPKIQALSIKKELQWHMIGHVQSRKAEDVCDIFSISPFAG